VTTVVCSFAAAHVRMCASVMGCVDCLALWLRHIFTQVSLSCPCTQVTDTPLNTPTHTHTHTHTRARTHTHTHTHARTHRDGLELLGPQAVVMRVNGTSAYLTSERIRE
jgi:hypothetical protein